MNTTAVTVKPVEAVRNSLEKMQPQFKAALPSHIAPEKFLRVVMTAIQGNAKLMEANRQSLYGACMKAAQDGLLPDGREAVLVMFGQQAQYMPMVAGVLKKVRNSGELLSISAHVIYEGDSFDYWIDDDGSHLKHKPNMLGERGKPTGVYAIAKTKDGGVYVEVMNLQDIEKVRRVSRSSASGPWKDWWDEMAKKTVIRRLSKRLPMSTDAEQVIQRDDDMYDLQGTTSSSDDTQAAPTSRLKRAVIAQQNAEIIDPPHEDIVDEPHMDVVDAEPAEHEDDLI